MKITLLFLAMFVSGCATHPIIDEKESQEKSRREAKRLEETRIEEESIARFNLFTPMLVAGLPMATVLENLGKPDKSEFYEGRVVHWYDCDKPFFLIYKKDVLEGRVYDTATITSREQTQAMIDSENRTNAQIGDIRREQRKQNFIQAIQGLQIQQNQQQRAPIQIPTRMNNYNGQGR